MTDDPSTNSERRWVCGTCGDDPLAHATPGSTCVWEPTLVTPSPVQDSERPGYQPPEFIRCDWCGRHGHCGNVICEVCAEKAAAPVPSPVPRRPDTAKLREPGYLAGSAIWAQRRKEAADWIDAQPAADQGPDLSEAAALLDEYDQSVHNLTRFGTVEAQTDHLLASERVAAFARRLLDREGGT